MKFLPFFGPGGILDILNVLGSRDKSSFDEIVSDPNLKIPVNTLKHALEELVEKGFVGESVHEGSSYYSLTGKGRRLGMFNQIEILKHNLEWFVVNEAMMKKVLEGIEQIIATSSDREVAEWYKGTMERLDVLVNEGTRNLIMQNCGYYGCASGNRDHIEKGIEERMKYKNIDEFLDAQVEKGAITRKGNTLYQTYEPRKYGVRCLCSLVNSLPDNGTVSPTYCQCSVGFVKKYWEDVLTRPVKVELIHSIMSGAQDCKFAIHL